MVVRVAHCIYLAFLSYSVIPNEFPSVSSHIAKYPMPPGMAILGCTTLPPSVEILEKSSTEGTSIVFVTLPPLPTFSCFILGLRLCLAGYLLLSLRASSPEDYSTY